MNKTLEHIKAGIDTYKKYKPTQYNLIKSHLDPIIFAIAIAKIESNFNYRAGGKDKEYGLYQFMPNTLTNTIKSYTSNVSGAKKLFYAYASSQTFVLMQLLYLNLKSLKAKGGKLNPNYEKLINSLPVDQRNLVRAAILHNQGTSSLTRQATNYNPLVFYVPQLLGALKYLAPNANIQSASVAGGVWTVASAAFPQLKVAGIVGKLAVVGLTMYIAYNTNLKLGLPAMINTTNASYRQALQDRFRLIWIAKGSEAAKQIDQDMKNEDHPLLNKPTGSGSNNNKPNTPKKDIPYGKIGVGVGTAKALSDVGDGTKGALDNLSKGAGDAIKVLPEKMTSLFSNPMFLGAVVGVFFLVTKKK